MIAQPPSRLASWLLGCLLPREDAEAVIGDLIEECALKQSESQLQRSWWYWSQVSRSLTPLVWTRIRRERWGAVFGAAIAAFILANIVEMVATSAIWKFVDGQPVVQVSSSLVVGLAAMALGGYIAAWLHPRASGVVALLIVVVVVAFMATMEMSGPLWYHFGFLYLVRWPHWPVAPFCGGHDAKSSSGEHADVVRCCRLS